MSNSRPTKILYLVTLAERGGAQRYVRDLARALDPAQFSVAVAAGGSGSLKDFCQAQGISFTALTYLRREISPWQDCRAIGEIARLLKELAPDILHLNSSKAGVLGALAARRARGIKVVYTAHGFVFGEPRGAMQRWLYRLAERSTAARKDLIICVSEADRQLALQTRLAPPEKLVTIHNGIDADAITFFSQDQAQTAIKKLCQLPTANCQLIGTIANLYPTKGLADVITALPEVLRRFPGVQLVVIGEGPERPALERQIQALGVATSCHLAGEVADAARLLPGFDVYLSSSLKEGFPYALLEAMAAKRPIAATAVGGVPEMIRANEEGLLVSPGQPVKLASAVIQLLEDPSLARTLGAAAFRRVRQEFTLQRMVEQTATAYQKILSQPG